MEMLYAVNRNSISRTRSLYEPSLIQGSRLRPNGITLPSIKWQTRWKRTKLRYSFLLHGPFISLDQ